MLDARRVAAAGIMLALGLGCGGDSGSTGTDAPVATTDISGWYLVSAREDGPCGMTESQSGLPSHVWVEPFGGIYYVRYCSSTAEADCYATPFYDFNEPIANGWRAEGGSAFFSADCTLSWERTSATLAGDELQVHSRRYSDVQVLSQEECTLAAAAALPEPCSFETQLTLSRI